MATIRVVGPYDRKSHPGVIRKMITRTSSPVGNPFEIGVDGDRHDVCKLFEDLVWIDWEVHVKAPQESWTGWNNVLANTVKAST